VRPCALGAFSWEDGVHVWRRARGPELVSVRVRAAVDAETEEAPTGAVSELLPPVARTIRFEPPSRAGSFAPMDVEDYSMSFAEVFPARRLGDALAPLWLLRRAGFEPEEQP